MYDSKAQECLVVIRGEYLRNWYQNLKLPPSNVHRVKAPFCARRVSMHICLSNAEFAPRMHPNAGRLRKALKAYLESWKPPLLG